MNYKFDLDPTKELVSGSLVEDTFVIVNEECQTIEYKVVRTFDYVDGGKATMTIWSMSKIGDEADSFERMVLAQAIQQ